MSSVRALDLQCWIAALGVRCAERCLRFRGVRELGRFAVTALLAVGIGGACMNPASAQEPLPSVRVPHPSAVVRRIEAALKQTVDWDLPPTPLDEFAAQLAERMEIPVVVDDLAFRAEHVDPLPLVGGRFRGIRLAAMLHWLLEPQYAGFTIRSETLFLTTGDESWGQPPVRLYRVGDLIDRWAESIAPDRVATRPFPYSARDAASDDLVDLLLVTVYISVRAGSGEPDMNVLGSHRVLWASGPYSMHEELERLLNELREGAVRENDGRQAGR